MPPGTQSKVSKNEDIKRRIRAYLRFGAAVIENALCVAKEKRLSGSNI